MTVLEEIIAYKKRELRQLKIQVPFKKLEQSEYFKREIIPLTDFLAKSARTPIIAEFKRKSPSKGIINELAEPGDVARGYANGGASGISVLTDQNFFGGSTEDFIRVREVISIPILRKDFIIDEYQVIESKAIGTDVILIIAACLSNQQSKDLARTAKSLGMQVILEIHESSELSLINKYVDIVGVNNRNLKTFEVDINTSLDLIRQIPSGFITISESGIQNPAVIKNLKESGYDGFLIGEYFMKEKDPVKAFNEFIIRL